VGASDEVVVYFDGLCEPVNPGGVATYGFVVKRGGKVVCKGKGVVGAGMWGDDVTNNVAEYRALIEALKCASKLSPKPAKVVVRGDSQLVIRQLRGEYKVRSERLKKLYEEAKKLVNILGATLEWVPRRANAEADALSREAFREFLDAHKEEFERYYRSGKRR